MLRIRMIEERIAELYAEQEMRCPVHLCIGQEAVAVGVCAYLSPQDYVFSSHRSHGHYLAKGGHLDAMMAEIYGKAAGCSAGKGGSMHLVDTSAGFMGATPIVGSTIPIAVGTALASQMRHQQRVSVCFFGEGATETGVFHESINFASLKSLPVVFVCENNLYSVYSSLDVRQPKGREVFSLAKAHGVESFQADGNDVLEVFEVTKKAVSKARRGKGPTFLEFKTYRWREHCGPNYDNDLGYRAPGEFEKWKKRCPIENLQRTLLRENILTKQDVSRLKDDFDKEMAAAVQFAKKTPFPQEKHLAEHLYA